jgi:D-apionolactonase
MKPMATRRPRFDCHGGLAGLSFRCRAVRQPLPATRRQPTTRFVSWLLLIALLSHTRTPAAEPIPLRAGPMSMIFEPDNAFLRYLKVGNDEVLRGINAPVRNQFWGTVPPQVKIVNLDQQSDQFTLKFDVACRERDVDFHWRGTIQGFADGKVEYTFDGQALSDFKRNRIGFCVLHGATAAGQPWVLETTSGEKVKGQFPQFISPHQPAKDLRAVAHEFAKDRWARVQFEGDVFEMEDQRNWTDASFKTYCTPLAIPYPVPLAKEERVQQKITITLDGDIPKQLAKVENTGVVTLRVGGEVAILPGIGLQLASHTDELAAEELNRLKALNLDHLRVDLTPADDHFFSRLRSAAEQAVKLDKKLVAGLHLGKSADSELKLLIAECQSTKLPVLAWLVIGADAATYAMARETLKLNFPEALIGFGQDTNFTELNRNRPDQEGLEVVSYGLNPQVHAFDNASMIETLPIQAETVRSARQFVGNVPLIISPVTLRVQAVSQDPLPGELPSNVDRRQSSLFAAGWTVGSLNYLGASGVRRITYYETVGWKGIMAPNRPFALQDEFPTPLGSVYPVYHILGAVGEFAGGSIQGIESTDSASIVGLALKDASRERLLVANVSNRTQKIAIQGFGKAATIFQLGVNDPTRPNAVESGDWKQLSPDPTALDVPFDLPPYGIARLDRSTN